MFSTKYEIKFHLNEGYNSEYISSIKVVMETNIVKPWWALSSYPAFAEEYFPKYVEERHIDFPQEGEVYRVMHHLLTKARRFMDLQGYEESHKSRRKHEWLITYS